MKKEITKSTTSTELTCSSLEQEGIKTSLNQNDVTEIIAQQKHDEIMALLAKAPKEMKEVFFHRDVLEREAKDSFKAELLKAKLITPKDLEGDYTLVVNPKEMSDFDWFSYSNLRVDETKNDVKLSLVSFRSSFSLGSHLNTITLTLKTSSSTSYKKGITQTDSYEKVFSKDILIDFGTKEEIQTRLDAFNKKIKDIYNSIKVPEKQGIKLIGLENLSRSARVTINSNIIKNQSPQLTAQLKKLFNVNL